MKLYIDPGTGSMLFTVLIGILGAGIYLAREAISKLRVRISGGKVTTVDRLPFAIYTDSKRYWTLFEPICDEFERRKQKIVYYTASPDDPALKKEYEYVDCQFAGEGNKPFGKLNYLKADVLLSTTPGLDVYQWKRSPDVRWYVHVPHAPADVTRYRMFGLDYYDAVLLSGEYQIAQLRELERKRGLPEKELRLVGLPILDEMQKRLDRAEPLPPHPTTVLLAPSWGASSIFGRFGGRAIEAALRTGYHVIVRPHPQSFVSEKEMIEDLMKRYPDSGQMEWNTDNDNFEVLRRSDILISDFSGVMFDYLLVFQKPVIYTDTNFDKSPYDACWVDDELWTFTTLEKVGRKLSEESLSDLKQVIDSVLQDQRYRDALAAARDETWCFRGEAAVRVTDYLIEKRKALLEEAEQAKKEPEPGKKQK